MIAIVSNVHSNLPALAEFLSRVERLKEEGKEVERIYIISAIGLMPYPSETVRLLSERPEGYIRVISGKYDRLIARWGEMNEKEKEEAVGRELAEVLDVYWDMLGHDGRKWLRTEPESFLTDKFDSNEFYFTYGLIDSPDEMPAENETPSYYESRFAELKKYEVISVAGRGHYAVNTKIGKIVCPGTLGVGKSPAFALVDTSTLAVSFESFSYNIKEVEDRINELEVSRAAKDLLREILYRKKAIP
ncbi:MAG: hypothetical protein GXO67_02610 [Archaeoglobi archaeon]|nr:hypothetical protein [Archaeoglobi archaeon]